MRGCLWGQAGRDLIVERIQPLHAVGGTQRLEVTAMLNGVRPEDIEAGQIDEWRCVLVHVGTLRSYVGQFYRQLRWSRVTIARH